MESEGYILDELNVTQDQNKLSKRFNARKETVFMSAYLFLRLTDRVQEHRVLLSNRFIYFLRRSISCCRSTGLTFARRVPIKEFKDITVDIERKCILLHLHTEDDCLF